MKERIFAISDIEMGKRDLMDDFKDDQGIGAFLDYLSQISEKTKLVLNGDIFDFLKMDYNGTYPRYITETISLWKLDRVLEHHPVFFEKLSNYLKNPHHEVYFVIGNHDADLQWPSLQAKLHEVLNCQDRVFFTLRFDYQGVQAEHGHAFDPFFKFKSEPFIEWKGQKILNLPVGSQIVFKYLTPFKRKFHSEEQLSPKHVAIRYFPEYHHAMNHMMRKYLFEGLLLDPIIHPLDPTYKVPYFHFLKHLMLYGFDVLNDGKFQHRRIQYIKKRFPDKRVFLLGHSHVLTNTKVDDAHILVTDTWRNEYHFDGVNKRKKDRTYAEVELENGAIQAAHMKIFTPENQEVSDQNRKHKTLNTDQKHQQPSKIIQPTESINTFNYTQK